jgi:hypothetical protein
MMNDENELLRHLLWIRHGCSALYGDDGEMQCGNCLIDFKRMSAADIQARFTQIGMEKLVRAQAGKPWTDGMQVQASDCHCCEACFYGYTPADEGLKCMCLAPCPVHDVIPAKEKP